MTGAIAANRAIAQVCDTPPTEMRLTNSVMQTARGCWKVKTRLHLSEITGYSVRACESWLACERKIPADALAALIRSEWGLEFLSSLMAESSVAWWRRLLRVNLVASVLRRRAADKRLLEKALESDDALAKTMGRAATALSLQDEDFGSVFADGVRAMVGAPRRAVAASKGK